MSLDPLLIQELRALFKAGATPSALIRHIAEQHADEPQIDRLVRAYFREAFLVPMLRIGTDQVTQIAHGVGIPSLNGSVLHQMVGMRKEWDAPVNPDDCQQPCWLDEVPVGDTAELLQNINPKSLPELAGSWDQIDEQARQFIRRILANAEAFHEEPRIAGALAERLQQQLHAARGAESPQSTNTLQPGSDLRSSAAP